MGLYNFQQRFVPFIEDGSKRHTIRGIRRNPDKPGDTCHLYTGLRQPGARLIFRAPCLRVEPIEINEWDGGAVYINGERLGHDEMDALAWRDGFRGPQSDWLSIGSKIIPTPGTVKGCFQQMLSFWNDRLPFEGHIVHWDYERREGAVHA